MKKAIVLVLALVLTMGLAVPAAAAGTSSPKAATASPSATAPLPTVVGEAKLIAATDAALTADEKTTMASAQAALTAVAPAGMKAQYFFFVKDAADGKLTVKVDNAAELTVMQFVDGKWVELQATVNADGTVTVEGVVDGPVVIFTK